MSDQTTLHCPRCGEAAERLREGYCEPCAAAGQSALDQHNARHDWWASLTPRERDQQIKDASR